MLIDSAGDGWRPILTIDDERHPLALTQRTAITADDLAKFLARQCDNSEAEPANEPYFATQDKDGWEVIDGFETGLYPVEIPGGPARNWSVKVHIAFIGANADGNPTTLRAGWWILLDDVSRPGLWSGTLANVPRRPAPLIFGSRVWIRPEHVLAIDPG